MNPESQRIAIAKACGWKQVDERAFCHPEDEHEVRFIGCWPYLPDYPNDLNDMHEAEKALSDSQQGWFVAYLNELMVMIKPMWDTVDGDDFLECGYRNVFPTVNATASQRAEAFLRTLNLWTED